ncbi:MAG: InlB B-repeat-containing protein, partial [Faecalibacterium sp.]|nr:InlB B-repeat-containing protein [Faecalibacterium sp.]
MKQKKQNRILAALLAVAMMFQMLPMLAFAAEETVPEAAKVKIDGKDKVYDNVKDAVEDAKSGDTIILGEGNYTLYKSDAATKGKDLTFVGKGTDKTAWNIGALVPDPANYGTEYNGDYSFDGAGTITFRDMTLRSGSADYLGFIRATNTVVDNCVINGKTFYWGYTSAVFKDTTFNAPSGDYALWTYSSPVMIFDGCTFNASGKAINVYTDYSAGKHDITVYFRDCTVNSSSSVKTALNINDSNMEVFKYIIYLSGNNTVNTNTWLDKTTCSRVFGFGDKPASDSGRTDVYVDGVLVWGKQENAQKGELKTHKYSAGEAERQVKRNEGGWNPQDDHYEREVTVKCDLCGRTETSTEKGYKLEYDLSEGEPAEGADYTDKIVAENETVTLAAAPTKEGYFFHYWEDPNGNHYTDPDIIKMTANTKLTAQWGEEPPEVPDTPEGPGCCGEVTGVIIAAGT